MVGPTPKPPNAWSARFSAASLRLPCGRAGWFDPAPASSNPPLPPDVAAMELPAADPDPPAPAVVAPATAPSTAAAPAVRAVTAAPINAPAVDPTSPLTILLAINGITAIANE